MPEQLQILIGSAVIYGVGALILYPLARKLTVWGSESRRSAMSFVTVWWIVMVLLMWTYKTLF